MVARERSAWIWHKMSLNIAMKLVMAILANSQTCRTKSVVLFESVVLFCEICPALSYYFRVSYYLRDVVLFENLRLAFLKSDVAWEDNSWVNKSATIWTVSCKISNVSQKNLLQAVVIDFLQVPINVCFQNLQINEKKCQCVRYT